MTSVPSTYTAGVAVRRVHPARTDPVRRILTIDAAFCIVAGTTLTAAAAPIADQADLAAPTVLQAIGAFLGLLGAGLAVLAGHHRAGRASAQPSPVWVTSAGPLGR